MKPHDHPIVYDEIEFKRWQKVDSNLKDDKLVEQHESKHVPIWNEKD
jgi:hypothetical protein